MRLNKVKGVSFDELTHSYICNDKLLIGVTGLMKKHGLSPDYGNIPQSVLEKAAMRGTAIHKQLEDYDNGLEVVEDENLKAYKELGLAVHCSEYLVSDSETVASFIDKVLEDCSLVDVKTTSSIHTRSVSWQLSIYAYLFELINPSKRVPHLYCAHVRNGKAKLIELPRIPDENVKALLDAERSGVTYEDTTPNHLAIEAISTDEVDILCHTISEIEMYKSLIKEAEAKVKSISEKMMQYMNEQNLKELSCATGTFVKKDEYERVSVDSAKLKKDYPEIYDKCIKKSTVSASLTFKH